MTEVESRRWEIYGAFLSDGVEFAINAHELQEVVRYEDKMASVPLSPAYFLGIFSLRDSIIPVINLRSLLGQETIKISEESCIAIVLVEGVRIGLLFDSTSEVLRVRDSQLNPFNYLGEASSSAVWGTLSLNEGERLVQVLNAKGFTKLENIPLNMSAQSSSKQDNRLRAKSKCITFYSNGIRYGFSIDSIREIIAEPEIEASGIKSRTCLGQTDLRGTTLPVIDFSVLCNAVRSTAADSAEKRVIIAYIDAQPVGFLVDGVDSIIEYFLDALQMLPPFESAQQPFCLGCINDDIREDISMVNHELLFSVPEVTAPVAAIAEGNAYRKKAEIAEQAPHTPQTYLQVQVNFSFSLAVEFISEIIEMPEVITPISRGPKFVDGMFNLRKILVTIIDLRLLYDFSEPAGECEQKLLIVKSGGHYLALKVDAVLDIFTSKAGMVHETPGGMVRGESAALQHDAKEAILHKGKVSLAIDFESMIARILRQLPAADVTDRAA